jgi:hypothetical protein
LANRRAEDAAQHIEGHMKTGLKKGKPRATKRERFDEMLRRPEGVALDEITKAFQVQPHSARAMISTARKRLGKEIELVDGRYRLRG